MWGFFINIDNGHSVHSLLWVMFGVNPHSPHIRSFSDYPLSSPPFVSPPERQDGIRCDVVCQVITLLNNPTGQAISLLLTHIVDLYSFTYKTIPSVNNYM